MDEMRSQVSRIRRDSDQTPRAPLSDDLMLGFELLSHVGSVSGLKLLVGHG